MSPITFTPKSRPADNTVLSLRTSCTCLAMADTETALRFLASGCAELTKRQLEALGRVG